MKQLCLFDNRTFDYWEYAKESLIENGIDDLTLNQIEEEACWLESMEWESMLEEVNAALKDAEGLLVSGTTQRWDGSNSGFNYVSWEGTSSLWEAFMCDCCVDCQYFTITLIDGVLHVVASHHDGTNRYEVRALTTQGAAAVEDWSYGYRFDNLTNAQMREKIEKSRRYYWTPIKVA